MGIKYKLKLKDLKLEYLIDYLKPVLKFFKSKEKINLELASEYLLMATWLTYLKSKLLLPESEEEEFKALEVAEKLKLQLKKLELIRLLSTILLIMKETSPIEIFLLGQNLSDRELHGGIRSLPVNV